MIESFAKCDLKYIQLEGGFKYHLLEVIFPFKT